MLKKAITFKNFDDQEVTEEYFFNLSKAEIIELEVAKDGLGEFLNAAVASGDNKRIYGAFKELVGLAFGRRVGDSFRKNSAWTEEFLASEAYSELIVEMMTDAGAAAAFVSGIIPAGLANDAKKAIEENPAQTTLRPEPRKITKAEAIEMDSDELTSLLSTGAIIEG